MRAEQLRVVEPDVGHDRERAPITGDQAHGAGVGVREVAPGVAEAFELPQDRICDACLEDALLLARITPPKKAKTR